MPSIHPMPEIGDHDEVIPPGDAYLDDFLALGQELPDRWHKTRVGHAAILAFIELITPGTRYRLLIRCCLAAPAVDGRPTSVLTIISGEWNPILNIIATNNILYRAQDQTMRCSHMYGSSDSIVRPRDPVDEADGRRDWVPLSDFLACIFRNPPEIL
jgi:hypothetical protein